MVTGGGTGIGFAIAAEMADAGADVVIVGRREEKLREAAGKIGEKCTWRVFDVTETEKYDEFFEELEKKAPIDILVNNAGINSSFSGI